MAYDPAYTIEDAGAIGVDTILKVFVAFGSMAIILVLVWITYMFFRRKR